MSARVYDGYPRHHEQPDPFGCQYYAFLSLTGYDLTEHAADVSEQRMQIRLFEAGYLMFPLYANNFEPASGEWWLQTFERMDLEPDQWAGLLVTIDSRKYPGVRHMVSAAVSGDERIRIFDPGCTDELEYGFDSFLELSPYSIAWEVFQIQSSSLSENPFVDGREMPHVKAAYSWATAEGQTEDQSGS